MTVEITDDSCSVGSGFSFILTNKEHDYLEGCVYTARGIVEVYSQGSDQWDESSTLRFVKDGTLHTRHFDRRYTKRGLVTKAKQFVEDVFRREDNQCH